MDILNRFRKVIFKPILVIGGLSILCKIALLMITSIVRTVFMLSMLRSSGFLGLGKCRYFFKQKWPNKRILISCIMSLSSFILLLIRGKFVISNCTFEHIYNVRWHNHILIKVTKFQFQLIIKAFQLHLVTKTWEEEITSNIFNLTTPHVCVNLWI